MSNTYNYLISKSHPSGDFAVHLPDWVKHANIYHIYPLGIFNAPHENHNYLEITPRLLKIRDFYDHFQLLGVNVVQFGPLFQSTTHGYDTTDYFKLDNRLGTNEDCFRIISELHDLSIKVMLDGVFNHVGRDFFAFQDVLHSRQASKYLDWFHIDFTSNNQFNDGFDYIDWEGHKKLVQLNYKNCEVREYIQSILEFWMNEMGVDAWRIDVAHMMDVDILQFIRQKVESINPNAILVGEITSIPYITRVNESTLHSATDYETYTSIRKALSEGDMRILASTLKNLYHPDKGIHRDLFLMNFLGNHDRERISTRIGYENLMNAFCVLYTIPGYPKIYYGDEFALQGKKERYSDWSLRQPLQLTEELTREFLPHIISLQRIRATHGAIVNGSLQVMYSDRDTIAYKRDNGKEKIIIVINHSTEVRRIELLLPNLGPTILLGNIELEIRDNKMISILSGKSSSIIKV
ncbi:MAG: hypothetical protein INQ03_15385 [Candidatus Heimdallarchaeota archaeon]|nr:hypothetical protein [Candidatus Heimdallarchaeota archaeon]